MLLYDSLTQERLTSDTASHPWRLESLATLLSGSHLVCPPMQFYESCCLQNALLITYVVCPKSVLIFLCTNWQSSTSLMYIGTLVVTLAACPYLFHLDWLSQSCATAVCVWSCFLTSLHLRCRKISNNSMLSNFVWNLTNLPRRHLLL